MNLHRARLDRDVDAVPAGATLDDAKSRPALRGRREEDVAAGLIDLKASGREHDVVRGGSKDIFLLPFQDIFKQWGAVWASAQDKEAPGKTGGRNARAAAAP